MKTIAIIGVGPRGLYALERLLQELSQIDQQVNIIVFEPCDEAGSGQVWYTNQSSSNWINITERALVDLKGRPELSYCGTNIAAFPSYHNWSNFNQRAFDPDTFPVRRHIGQYLHERYLSIETSLEHLHFERIKAKVERIHLKEDILKITTDSETYSCDDVLLTIGHQPTETSKQIETWKSHSKSNQETKVFENTYPLSQFSRIKNQTNITIGIRGFGLAMIDVMRELVNNSFGNFEVVDRSSFKTKYSVLSKQNIQLIPFSLDGLPMAPKPLNQSIDDWFKPSDKESHQFKTEINSFSRANCEVNSISFLMSSISKIVARVYNELNAKAINHNCTVDELKSLSESWLEDTNFKHNLIQDQTIDTYTLIGLYINMALGKHHISLDYCIGQVWRHCQPTLYSAISHAKLDDDIIKQIIDLDERIKRFSYGPPIESLQQIIALVDSKILSLDFVNDPDIETVKEGWKLNNSSGQTATVSVMINSVLDSPKLLDVNSSIIKKLLHDDIIAPTHNELGIDTKADGYVTANDEHKTVPIAVLGRLAKGSIIGVDAILECFGPRIEHWAKAYTARLTRQR